MRNDKKADLAIFLGIVFIATAIIIFGLYIIFSIKAKNDYVKSMQESIRDTKAITLEYDNNSVNNINGLVDNITIEALDSDQIIKEVTDNRSVLEIPDLGVKANIYSDVTMKMLKDGIGWYPETKKLGEKGNCCLAGHSSDTYNCILNGIENLEILSSIYVYDEKGTKHTYYIISKSIVDPKMVSVLDTFDESKSYLTIITCTDKGRKRLCINCAEFSDEELKNYEKSLEETYVNNILGVANEDVNMFELYNFLTMEDM